MKKYIMLMAVSLFTISADAIDVASNVSVYGGVDAVSSYVFRGDRLANEAVQPYAGIAIHGNETEWGTIDIGAWFSVGYAQSQLKQPDLYREMDICVSYSTPGGYVKLGATYFNYFGYCGKGFHQCELGVDISMGKIPLTLGWYTMVYNNGGKDYSTYLSLKYEANLGKGWTLTPEIGCCFALGETHTVGYVGNLYDCGLGFNDEGELVRDETRSFYMKNIFLIVDKYFQVHDMVGVHIGGFIATNLYDIGLKGHEFEYGKNINVGIAAGFSF